MPPMWAALRPPSPMPLLTMTTRILTKTRRKWMRLKSHLMLKRWVILTSCSKSSRRIQLKLSQQGLCQQCRQSQQLQLRQFRSQLIFLRPRLTTLRMLLMLRQSKLLRTVLLRSILPQSPMPPSQLSLCLSKLPKLQLLQLLLLLLLTQLTSPRRILSVTSHLLRIASNRCNQLFLRSPPTNSRRR